MDIGIQEIVDVIASSTTAYLVTFSPLFLMVGGLILAMVVIFALIGFFPNGRRGESAESVFDMDAFDDKADELEEFFSRRGRSGAPYDYDDIERMI